MKKIKVLASDPDGAYGTRSSDKDISLGRADVFKLVAVYDSEALNHVIGKWGMTKSGKMKFIKAK